jgi:hypothetical protein
MPKIFLSHSTEDNDTTTIIADTLRQAGFDVWVDFENIGDGARWLREIQNGIDDCDAVVVILSKASRQSEWVEKECLYTFGLKKPIFIALIEDVLLPLHLVNIQYTDCRQHLADGMTDLVEALRHRLGSDEISEYAPDSNSSVPTEDNFFSYVEQLPLGDTAMLVAKDLYFWAQYIADEIDFGGRYNPVYHVKVDLNETQVTVFSIWAYPRTPSIQIPLDRLANFPPYNQLAVRIATLGQLNQLMPDGSSFDKSRADRRPTMPLHYLSTAQKLEDFKQVIVEIINRLRAE